MRTQIKRVVTLVTILLLVLVSACIPTAERVSSPPAPIPAHEPEPMPTAKWGIIEIRVTDPPPADVISANVTLDNIEVHREGGGWETIDIGENVTFDLMDVVGVTEVLGSANVTAGSFTQIRMDVAKVDVVFSTDSGTDNVTARVPSEKLKIVKAFEVIGGTKTALTLDFDGKRSLVLPGKDIETGKQKAIFNPVVHLLVEHPAEQPTATYKPDNWIRNQGESQWSGDNEYNLTGINQAASQSVADNVTANYEIMIENDGNSSDSFIVTGNATSGNWTVEYYDSSSVNITANVTGSGWSTGILTSGNYTWISANITPSGLPGGSSFDVLVTSQSVGDPDQKDTVKASTSVTATYRPDNWIRNQGESQWSGDNEYNLTGINQAASQSVADNVTANYEITIQNDGNSSDSFIVTGNATSGNWTVEYYDSSSVNITANVTGSGWLTGILTSGNYTWISANITPSGLPGGSLFDVLVTSQSVGDPDQKDTVKASANVTAG